MSDRATRDQAADQNTDIADHVAVVTAKDEDPRKPANDGSTSSPKVDRSANEHAAPRSSFRNPDDETPANWNSYVVESPPGTPYRLKDIVPGAKCPAPPGRVTLDHQGTVPQEADPHLEISKKLEQEALKPERGAHASDRAVGGAPQTTRDPNAPNLERGGDPPVMMNDYKLGIRQQRWDAYRLASMHVDGVQRSVAPDVDQFFAADKNPELADLGFIVPKGFHGSLDALANKQEVPNRGGQAVGGLFRADNTLATTKQDEHAFASAAQNARKHGGPDNAFVETREADKRLSAAIAFAHGGENSLDAASNKLRAAVLAIEHNEATLQAGEAREEIEGLTQGKEAGLHVLEFVIGGPAKALRFATAEGEGEGEGLGPAESIGTLGTMLINAIPSDQLLAARSRLASAEAKIKSSKAEGLRAELESAMSGMLAQLDFLSSARGQVSVALAERRIAYNKAGAASGAVADGDHASKAKVSATISAIPIVESVVGTLRAILEKARGARPQYSEEAGVGYGMALYHQTEAAWELPNAIGSIEYCTTYFGTILADWSDRLKALTAKKTEIAGAAPGGQA